MVFAGCVGGVDDHFVDVNNMAVSIVVVLDDGQRVHSASPSLASGPGLRRLSAEEGPRVTTAICGSGRVVSFAPHCHLAGGEQSAPWFIGIDGCRLVRTKARGVVNMT